METSDLSNESLEQEISDIEKRLAEKRAEFESQQKEKDEKEILHEVVGEKIKEHVPEYEYPAIEKTPAEPAAPILPAEAEPPHVNEPPSYLSEELKGKVQELVNIAFQKSPMDAIGKLKKDGNPALIAAFHGILVDQLYSILIERGKIKKL